jgi:hypothetical protein
MLSANNVVALGVCVVAIAAAFTVGRSTAPSECNPAPENLATALQAALGEPDVLDRTERTAQLLQHLNPENVAEVSKVYHRMLNILGELAIRPYIAAWARFDPEAALQHTLRWPFQDKMEMGAQAAIEAWALRDPAGAVEAYEEVSARRPGLKEVLLFDMLTGWVYSGHGGVEEYIANLPTAKLDIAINRVAAKTLRNGGVDAIIQWVDSITGNDAYGNRFKKKAFQRGSRMVARWDSERAAAWAMENRGQNYAIDGPRIVAEQWGMQDGRAALEWVRNHPDEDLHHRAAREAFRTWLEADRTSAVEWIESEELAAFHDPAVILYAKNLGTRAPAEAVEWCERIFDEQRRLACLEQTATRWYQRDAVAAEAWLQQSPLDEEARSKARTPAEKRRPQRGPNRRRPEGDAANPN